MTRRRPRRHRPPNPDANPSPPPLLRDLPPDERPRQRLLRSGGPSLSDPELLSIILGNGCREVCSLDLARQILEEVRGLVGLVGIQAETLQRRGIGEAKAASVLASLELARRLARAEIPEREVLDRPAEIALYLMLRYAIRDQEVMGALYLDARHRLIAESEIFKGTLIRAATEPRPILCGALAVGAAGVASYPHAPKRRPVPIAGGHPVHPAAGGGRRHRRGEPGRPPDPREHEPVGVPPDSGGAPMSAGTRTPECWSWRRSRRRAHQGGHQGWRIPPSGKASWSSSPVSPRTRRPSGGSGISCTPWSARPSGPPARSPLVYAEAEAALVDLLELTERLKDTATYAHVDEPEEVQLGAVTGKQAKVLHKVIAALEDGSRGDDRRRGGRWRRGRRRRRGGRPVSAPGPSLNSADTLQPFDLANRPRPRSRQARPGGRRRRWALDPVDRPPVLGEDDAGPVRAGILPAPTPEERDAIAETYRRAKLEPPTARPFRAPHFTPGRRPGGQHRPQRVAGSRVPRVGSRRHDRPAVRQQPAGHQLRRPGRAFRAYDLVVAAGVESMGRVPMGTSVLPGSNPFGEDMTRRYPDGLVPQGISAELIAAKWGFSRSQLDEFSAGSHDKAARATKDGLFDNELIPSPGSPPTNSSGPARRSRRWPG